MLSKRGEETVMIKPGTYVKIALVPIERIVVTEHQKRYPERVIHYLKLLLDPRYADEHPGYVHLAPYGDPALGMYTLLDGHHRYVASIIAGRAHVLAMIEIEPGWQGYTEAVAAGDGLIVPAPVTPIAVGTAGAA